MEYSTMCPLCRCNMGAPEALARLSSCRCVYHADCLRRLMIRQPSFEQPCILCGVFSSSIEVNQPGSANETNETKRQCLRLFRYKCFGCCERIIVNYQRCRGCDLIWHRQCLSVQLRNGATFMCSFCRLCRPRRRRIPTPEPIENFPVVPQLLAQHGNPHEFQENNRGAIANFLHRRNQLENNGGEEPPQVSRQ